jgi:hypothetical protein
VLSMTAEVAPMVLSARKHSWPCYVAAWEPVGLSALL